MGTTENPDLQTKPTNRTFTKMTVTQFLNVILAAAVVIMAIVTFATRLANDRIDSKMIEYDRFIESTRDVDAMQNESIKVLATDLSYIRETQSEIKADIKEILRGIQE